MTLPREDSRIVLQKKASINITFAIHVISSLNGCFTVCGRRNTDSESDEAGIEILQDLDNALEEDEQMTFEEIKEKVKRMNLTFRQYAPQSTDCVERPQNDYNDSFYSGQSQCTKLHSEVIRELLKRAVLTTNDEHCNCKYLDIPLLLGIPFIGAALDDKYCGERCRTKPSHHKRHEPYMDAEKSDKYVSNVAAPKLNEAVIGELKKMPNGINSLAQYKQEKQKEIIDKENQVRSQIENIKKEYTAEMFIDQTPIYFKGTETEIPRWKRLLMAQKIAAEAIRQREADLWVSLIRQIFNAKKAR
ncbi:unnamed protein product [Toxocara canis]|uniref:Minor capsid protein n=1 Tax=Toxocara canis TaxID=6265 RepID=A0A183V1T2_TOXCA|nr:unnamed protein product [Toxocara canis]